MISGIAKKLIFSCFLFVNFTQPSKSADLQKINDVKNNRTFKLNRPIRSDRTNLLDWSNFTFNEFPENSFDKKYLDKYSEPLIADIGEKEGGIVIQSDQQSELNGVINAQGNVEVEYQGKILKADNLIYDKSTKKINAEGNITFIMGNQIFRSSKIEYSFINEKGYLLDVKGSFNTGTLIDDLSSNFRLVDSNKIKNLLEFKKIEVLNTP